MKRTTAYRFDSREQLKALIDAYPEDFFAFHPNGQSAGFMFNAKGEMGRSWSSCSWQEASLKNWDLVTFDQATQSVSSSLTNMNTKIGTTVKCVKPLGSSFLRKDVSYLVVSVNQHGNIQVKELGSDPKTSAHWYLTNRFVEVKTVAASPVSCAKKYKTRSGLAVTLYTATGQGEYPVVGSVQEKDGTFSNVEWTAKGEFIVGSIKDYDLIELKPAPHSISVKVSPTSTSDIAVVYQTYVKVIASNLSFNEMVRINEAVAEMKAAIAAIAA